MRITKYLAQATNGWIAVEVQLNRDDPDQFPTQAAGMKAISQVSDEVEEIRVSKPAAEGVFKALPKNAFLPVLQKAMVGANGDDDPVLAVTDLDSSRIFKTEKSSGQFPDLEAVRPKEEPLAAFVLDAYLLSEFLKVIRDFKSLKAQDSPLVFEVYDNEPGKGTKPISIHAKNDEGHRLRALVMPMQLDHVDDFRFKTEEQLEAEWQKELEAAKEAAKAQVEEEEANQDEQDDDASEKDALQELADEEIREDLQDEMLPGTD
jgi:hypothetical protein